MPGQGIIGPTAVPRGRPAPGGLTFKRKRLLGAVARVRELGRCPPAVAVRQLHSEWRLATSLAITQISNTQNSDTPNGEWGRWTYPFGSDSA